MKPKIKILAVVFAFVLLTTTFFGCAPQTNAQYEGATNQSMQNEYDDQETGQQKEQETTPQKTKMSYDEARNWLVEYTKKGTYDAEENKYIIAIKEYETGDSEFTEGNINLLILEYAPEENKLSLVDLYASEDTILEWAVVIDKYKTTEMTAQYSAQGLMKKYVNCKTTKDSYRPGVNIPCSDYTYFGVDGFIKNHTLKDEQDASNSISSVVADMLVDFDMFLKEKNAGFDMVDLGYSSFYGA